MIKKITNWTFGSIFRTIGRFLAYIIIGIIISLIFIKKDYIKAETIYSDTIQNAFLQDCSWRIDGGQSASTTNCGWDNNFRTATIDTSNSSGHGTIHFTSTNLDSMYHILVPNTSNVWLAPYEIEFQVRVDYSSINSFSTIAIDNNPSSGASYYYANTYDNGISFNFFPVYSNLDTQLWKGGLCRTNSSNNDGSYKYYTISCNVPSGAYGVSEIRMMYYYNRTTSNAYQASIDVGISTNVNYKFRDILIAQQYANSNNIANSIIDGQTNQTTIINNGINGEVNGTGINGTITDQDAMNNSCGIICKLKHLISMFSLDNLKYLIVPTEEQMNDLFEQMQTKITSKIGIMGLPITVYTRLMQIAMQYDDSNQNWCLQWNAIPVPNFEDYNIIESGQWCFSDILENQTMNTFRNACITIIGGLILLSFIQYLYNCLHRILDVPIQDNYEYFTVENVYGINPETGEVQSHDYRERTTTRR